MPEVCEVALTAEILSSKIKGQSITAIKILSGRYTKKEPDGFAETKKILKKYPLEIRRINSKGKFLYMILKYQGKHLYLMNTFGLTGMWGFEKEKNSRMELTLDNKKKVWFTDDRNFGTIKFTSDKNELVTKLNRLAPDWLKENYSLSDFKKKIKELSQKKSLAKKKIIDILMDQETLGSGIGNYLAPEILYRAKISPHQLLGKMNFEQIKKLWLAIRKTVKVCYYNNHVGYMVYLDSYLKDFQYQEYLTDVEISDKKFEFLIYQQKKDPLGNPVKAEKIRGSRTTYWVPKVQKVNN